MDPIAVRLYRRLPPFALLRAIARRTSYAKASLSLDECVKALAEDVGVWLTEAEVGRLAASAIASERLHRTGNGRFTLSTVCDAEVA